MTRRLRPLLYALLVASVAAVMPVRINAQDQGRNQADMQRAMQAYQDYQQTDALRRQIQSNKAGVVADIMGRWAQTTSDEKARTGFSTAFMNDDPEKLLQIAQATTWDQVLAIQLGVNTLGQETQDLVFNPLPPCRALDTRLAAGAWLGPFSSPQTVSFYVTDALNANGHTQGGAANCGFPFSVGTGVALNITVVPAGNSGDLRIWPFGGAAPNASIINFIGGLNLANAATVAIANSNSTNDLTIQVEFATNVHIIVDVIGYFAASHATPVEMQRTVSVNTAIANGAFATVNSPACPAGFTLMGGGYFEAVTTSGFWVFGSRPNNVTTPTFWTVEVHNLSGIGAQLTVYALCGRVPGR